MILKSINLLLALLAFSGFAFGQEELPKICTEITYDPADYQPDSMPRFVARAVAYKPELGKYWENGRVIKVGFLGGTEAVRSKVRKYAQEWSQVANVTFAFVEKGPTDLRISFREGLGTWSMIGTDAKNFPQHQPTMNFGWFTSRSSEWEIRATVLHEFGHSLGLLHEHQHPKGGIPWDKPKLYQYYRATQGWSKDQVDQQVLARLNLNRTQYSAYDPYSIMHYPIPNSLTVGDFEVNMNANLSPTDKAFIARLYPKKKPTVPAGTGTGGGTGTTTTKPSNMSVTVRDVLSEGQKFEQVWITVNGLTKSFSLSYDRAKSKELTLELPRTGQHSYEIYTKTVYVKRVNGRNEEYILHGYGEGVFKAGKSGCYDLFVGKAINSKWVEISLQPCK